METMWTKELFGVNKPIIALLHLRALPGDPGFDREGGMERVLDWARKDLHALQEGGVNGILFANEFSLPYQVNAPYALPSAMAWVIGRLQEEIRVPFGVNVVYNPLATIDLAAATGASFVRSAFTGSYMGEYGVMHTDPAAAVRRREELGLRHLKMLYKVNPESDAYLVARDPRTVAKSILFACSPDGLCVSGASAGSETSDELLASIHAVAGEVPVFCNTGCNIQTVETKLAISDGACVGTTFKYDGDFRNGVDVRRVKAFMEVARRCQDAGR